jgi:hypothetical protein
MGEQRVSIVKSQDQMQQFVKSLLDDVKALEYMIDNDWFEKDIVRIGAEQEMVLVDQKTFKPACINMEALKHMEEWTWVETELAKFNLEINLEPREFSANALRDLEDECTGKLRKSNMSSINLGLRSCSQDPSTLRKFDLDMNNLRQSNATLP